VTVQRPGLLDGVLAGNIAAAIVEVEDGQIGQSYI
jgi:hypothetical protein